MRNIVLIGMPGVGKSTIGVILAKELGMEFVDTDLCIQKREGLLLKDIISRDGVDGFIAIEEDVNANLNVENSIIATGGSVIYGPKAMKHLKEIGTVVYLKLPVSELSKRLSDIKGRGVVLRPGQTLETLFEERLPLYEKYADIVIDETGADIEETLNKIINTL